MHHSTPVTDLDTPIQIALTATDASQPDGPGPRTPTDSSPTTSDARLLHSGPLALALTKRLDPRLRRIFLLLIALCSILAAGLPVPAHAATIKEWTGLTNGNWTDPSNWVGGLAPSPDDDLFFPENAISKTTINTFPSGTRFSRLIFEGSGYTVGGNRFAIVNGIVAVNPQLGNTISAGVDLLTNQTIEVQRPGASLTILGTINFDGVSPGQTPFTHMLTIVGKGDVDLGPLVATSATASNGLLIVDGPGSTTLQADSPSFGSAIIVSGGTLRVGTPKALGTTSQDTVVFPGGTLELVPSGALQLPETLQLAGNGPAGTGALVSTSGATTINGSIFLTAAAVGIDVASGSTLTLGGPLSAPANTPDAGLTKLGPGTLVLAAASQATGPNTIKAGILEVRNGDALGPSGAKPTTVENGATVELDGTVNVGRELIVNGSGVDGQGALRAANGAGAHWSGLITLASDAAVGVPSGTFLTLDGRIVGPGGLTKVGTGTLRMEGGSGNDYKGVTRVTDGVFVLGRAAQAHAIPGPLVIQKDSAPVPATVLLQNDGQINFESQVTVGANGLLDLNGRTNILTSLTLTGGQVTTIASTNGAVGTLVVGEMITQPSTTPATIAGQISLNVQVQTFTIADGGAAVDLDITAAILNGGAKGGLTKAGPGTLRLAGNSSYTGATTVSDGTLIVDGTQSASPISLAGGRLIGSGSVGPIAATGGVLGPGPSSGAGTLTSGGVQLNGASAFAAELNGLQAPAQDRLVANGAVALGDAALQLAFGFTPDIGTSLTLIENKTASAVGGAFRNLPEGATLTAGSSDFTISYKGGDGNDVVLTRITSAPPAPTPSPTPPTPTPPGQTPPTQIPPVQTPPTQEPPTPTPTPIPAPGPSAPAPAPGPCAPRPNVSVQVQPTGPGRLQVSVTVGTQPATPDNHLVEPRIQPGTNALVDVAGRTGLTGAANIPLETHPSNATFFVRRAQDGQPVHLPFVVVDDCGLFPTFVGGGPTAF